MSDDPFADGMDAFSLVTDVAQGCDPREIAALLVADDPDHIHLKLAAADILFLFRRDPKFLGNDRIELGSMNLPTFSGKNGALARWLMVKAFGAIPDFVMIIDQTFWNQAPREQKIALIDHELTHAVVACNKQGEERFGDDGRPVWAIKPHDIEEFDRVVAKHGAWKPDIASFLAAAGYGGRLY